MIDMGVEAARPALAEAREARDRRIIAHYECGASGRDLARQFGLSRERIFQIVRKRAPQSLRPRGGTELPPEERTCVQCGTIFIRKRSSQQRYCSALCRGVVSRKPTTQQCYELRRQGMNWADIAAATGLKSAVVATVAAKRWALREGHLWPLPIGKVKRGEIR